MRPIRFVPLYFWRHTSAITLTHPKSQALITKSSTFSFSYLTWLISGQMYLRNLSIGVDPANYIYLEKCGLKYPAEAPQVLLPLFFFGKRFIYCLFQGSIFFLKICNSSHLFDSHPHELENASFFFIKKKCINLLRCKRKAKRLAKSSKTHSAPSISVIPCAPLHFFFYLFFYYYYVLIQKRKMIDCLESFFHHFVWEDPPITTGREKKIFRRKKWRWKKIYLANPGCIKLGVVNWLLLYRKKKSWHFLLG